MGSLAKNIGLMSTPEKLAEMVALWEQYEADNGVLDAALDLGEMVH